MIPPRKARNNVLSQQAHNFFLMFWDYLKKLNNKRKSGSNTISADTWVEHFSSLNKKDPALDPSASDYCKMVEREVEDLLGGRVNDHCPFLDKEFTVSEIEWGIKQLKKGKSSGLDAISNDIIKAC